MVFPYALLYFLFHYTCIRPALPSPFNLLPALPSPFNLLPALPSPFNLLPALPFFFCFFLSPTPPILSLPPLSLPPIPPPFPLLPLLCPGVNLVTWQGGWELCQAVDNWMQWTPQDKLTYKGPTALLDALSLSMRLAQMIISSVGQFVIKWN